MPFEDEYENQVDTKFYSGDQPAKKSVERIRRTTKFNRLSPDSAVGKIELQTEQGLESYNIEKVEDGKSELLARVQDLQESIFDPNELDVREVLQNGVEGKSFMGTPTLETPYRVFSIKDEKGEVVSAIIGGQLDLLDSQGAPTGDTMVMIVYALTKNDAQYRQKGFAREAYASLIMDACQEAEKRGRRLAFAAGECTFTSEKYWNSVGWSRAYAGQTGGKTYQEAPYIQPALNFDADTGDIAEGAGQVPEHLMVDSFTQTPPNAEQLSQTVAAFYRWSNHRPPEAFSNDAAYQKFQNYIAGLRNNFESFLADKNSLLFLSAESRKKAENKLTIDEYLEADHKERINTPGKEDF